MSDFASFITGATAWERGHITGRPPYHLPGANLGSVTAAFRGNGSVSALWVFLHRWTRVIHCFLLWHSHHQRWCQSPSPLPSSSWALSAALGTPPSAPPHAWLVSAAGPHTLHHLQTPGPAGSSDPVAPAAPPGSSAESEIDIDRNVSLINCFNNCSAHVDEHIAVILQGLDQSAYS